MQQVVVCPLERVGAGQAHEIGQALRVGPGSQPVMATFATS